MKIPKFVLITIVVAFTSLARAELRGDQLVLIVNKNSADSAAIAEFYVKARQLPANRIITLDLPTGDDITFDQYQQAADQVRQFLEANKLREQIKCIVTTFGVPLRIGARTSAPEQLAEVKRLKFAAEDARLRILDRVVDLERRARDADATFNPVMGTTLDHLAKRVDQASSALMRAAQRESDPRARQQKQQDAVMLNRQFSQPVSTNPSDPTPASTTAPTVELERRAVRAAAARRGIVMYARAIQSQIELLSDENTDAAFDSELAVLWWGDYPRAQWMPNPMFYRFTGAKLPQTVMTMRLDGPTPQIVKDMIATAVQVERDGLKGAVVIDAGGSGVRDPEHKEAVFTNFDERLVGVAEFIKQHTKLRVVVDQKTEILPAHSVDDVALYSGWYALANYTPSCKFARGAVAYHIASTEMTTLHSPTKEWCRNLLNDGAVATIGPVSEPFLGAFPLPSDFFPLLLTGKLTLAEVYWRSVPMASWKMCALGDPLYTPFAAKPALDVSDLPPQLKAVFPK